MLRLLLSLAVIARSNAHGYLKTPRSRNLVAYQDKNWETFYSGGSSADPYPEDCPHCLNRGGTLAQCGVLFGATDGLPWERNYDLPQNVRGDPMPPNIQGVYKDGSVIEVEVLVTTHHKGHFELAVCPIQPLGSKSQDLNIPTADCFAQNKLTFLSDELYNAPQDPLHPERAYIVPSLKAEWVSGKPGEQPVVGAYYKMKFQLPQGVNGEIVLLQWYYLTANSCKHEGYDDYDWPAEWGDDVLRYGALPDCEVVPEDGDGVPEQFWNCAEVKIVGESQNIENDEFQEDDDVFVDSGASSVDSDEPCKDDSSSYYTSTNDCSGYVYCMAGAPGEVFKCSAGQLYDEAQQRCNWEDEVLCISAVDELYDEDGNPLPTRQPSPPPTPPPNPLLEWNPNAVNRGHDKTIIGYYASWQWYDRDGLAAPINMDFTKITRANFAFFQITEGGDIYGTDNWADPITLFGYYDWMAEEGTADLYCSWDEPGEPPNCSAHKYEEGLIYLAHKAGAEVYPSIGGWSLSDPFPVMAANPQARARFASQCIDLIKSYNFDGIDLDWEYPGYEPHSGTPDDTINFNLLLDDVRAALDELEVETGKFYGLTAALPCGPSIIDNQDIAHVSMRLTELNLMTYDFHGSWNENAGVNAPLYDQEGSEEFSVHGCVANWFQGGATKEKINIGFPFYGRSFIGAKNLYEKHDGNDESTWHMDEGVPQYYNIMDKMNEMTTYRDEQTMTEVAYSATGMVSYDDERAICDKTEYAMVHNLNGYIIWELSGDIMPDLSTPLLDAANAKLRDPSLDCISIAELKSHSISGTDGPADQFESYYPDFGNSICQSGDVLDLESMKSSDVFGNVHDCCLRHFSWNQNCVADSPVKESDGSTVEVEQVVPTPPPTRKPVSLSTRPPSSEPSPSTRPPTWMPSWKPAFVEPLAQEKPIDSLDTNSRESRYYPLFDGVFTVCENTGPIPSWISESSLRYSKTECCQNFAFPQDYDKCMDYSDSPPILGGDTVFFPNFRAEMCVNSETEEAPSYMSGTYFEKSNYRCCSKFFSRNAQSLQKCESSTI